MAIKNNYWKELKYKNTYYHVGTQGWEVSVYSEDRDLWNKSNMTRKKVIIINMPKSITREARKDFRIQYSRNKRIAQSVSTEEEYKKLWKRIDESDWEMIEEQDLKDDDLVRWAYNTRTADEYYRLLRYN